MKRLLPMAMLAITSAAYSGPSVIHPGSSMGAGLASNKFSLYGAHGNPAAGNLLIAPDEKWRLSYAPSAAFSMEVGEVDSFTDDLNELVDLLDDPGLIDEPVQDVLDRFNATLEVMGEDGYTKLSFDARPPLAPLHWRPDWAQGTLSFDLNMNVQGRLSVLDDELQFDHQNLSFTTGTAAYVKSGIESVFSLGYSRPVFELEEQQAQLLAGVRAKVINLQLSKQVFLLELLDGRDVADLISDEYDNNLVTTTDVGLDLALLWQAQNYSAGITIANINEPSFEYGPVGVNCDTRVEGSDDRSNCGAADYFANERGDIRAQETHTKYALATVDGSVSLRENWLLMANWDLGEYNDLVGDEYQWLNVATAYYPQTAWVPDVRLGFRKNMVGSELSSMTAGISLGAFNVDVEWSLDTATFEGNEIPRSFGVAIGFAESF